MGAARGLGMGQVVDWAARRVARRSGDCVSALEEFVQASEIDVVWFLVLGHGPVSIYITTPYHVLRRTCGLEGPQSD